MNGEFKELLDAYITFGRQLHKENLTKFEKIFSKLEVIDKHEGFIFYAKIYLGFLSTLVIGLIWFHFRQ